MLNKPTMTWDEAKAIVDAKPFPKITKEAIEGEIAAVRYLMDGTTTICIIEVDNGFKFIGHSTPASPENFDPEVGKVYAYDNTFRQMWSHLGYALRQQLWDASRD